MTLKPSARYESTVDVSVRTRKDSVSYIGKRKASCSGDKNPVSFRYLKPLTCTLHSHIMVLIMSCVRLSVHRGHNGAWIMDLSLSSTFSWWAARIYLGQNYEQHELAVLRTPYVGMFWELRTIVRTSGPPSSIVSKYLAWIKNSSIF